MADSTRRQSFSGEGLRDTCGKCLEKFGILRVERGVFELGLKNKYHESHDQIVFKEVANNAGAKSSPKEPKKQCTRWEARSSACGEA